MKNIKQYSKIDHKTLHFLPFVPSRTRKKGYALVREYGNWILEITARETLNMYDFINLLYIVKEYMLHGYQAGYIGEGKDKREVAGINIDVKKFLQLKGIGTNKNNRNSFKKSVMRLKSIDLVYINKETKKERHTSYIYEFEVDEDINEIKIYANKAFIDFVANQGILINLERLKLYKDDKNKNTEQYAILLDLYLQGTKIPYLHNKKTYYKYRDKYSFDEIEKALKFDLTNMRNADKLKKMKETFKQLHEKGNMPLYKYNKIEKVWEKFLEEK